MGYASRLGKARISSSNPQAAAICDRCGGHFNHVDLKFQFDFAGPGLINKRLLVCDRCDDDPQPQLRAIIIPADPIPILNPRPQDYSTTREDKRITIGPTTTDPTTGLVATSGDQRTTQDNDDRIIQKNGDDMLAPKLVTFVRITSSLDDRITMSKDVRITQWMAPFTPNPIPSPSPYKEAVVLTMSDDFRITENGNIRDLIYVAPIEAIPLTMDGQTRITEDTRVRELDYVPTPAAATKIKRVFVKHKKTEK